EGVADLFPDREDFRVGAARHCDPPSSARMRPGRAADGQRPTRRVAPGGPRSGYRPFMSLAQKLPRMPTMTVVPGSYRSLTALSCQKLERRFSPVRFSTFSVSCGWVGTLRSV